MNFVIEDKPVNLPSLVDEAAALLQTLKIGQSFLVPAELGSRMRERATRIPGKFSTRTEGANLRIGRVA